MIFVQPGLVTALSVGQRSCSRRLRCLCEKIPRVGWTDSDISCNCCSYPGNDRPDIWWHLPGLTATHQPGLNITVYFTEICNLHPLMYHPNFDIKGVIINSLKLSQNQNIYFIQDQHWILNLFLIILDSHNHLLQSTLCYNHSLQTVTTTKKKIM